MHSIGQTITLRYNLQREKSDTEGCRPNFHPAKQVRKISWLLVRRPTLVRTSW